MELRARFDEENNISWSKVLEDSGCQIIYGVEGYKCHSKICLITVKKGETLSYITQIGTGNYNEKTNRMYTDLSMMTADPQIGLDGTVFFQNMLLGNLGGNYKTADSAFRHSSGNSWSSSIGRSRREATDTFHKSKRDDRAEYHR